MIDIICALLKPDRDRSVVPVARIDTMVGIRRRQVQQFAHFCHKTSQGLLADQLMSPSINEFLGRCQRLLQSG